MNGKSPEYDPVFQKFERFSGRVPMEFYVDFLGTKTRREYMKEEYAGSPSSFSRSEEWAEGDLPEFDEEYYEWVDVLEAAESARDTFTMVELGGGFARWAVRGALAAQQRGIERVKLAVVEPEPVHIAFMRQHFADNDIGPELVDIYEGVISEDPGQALCYVRQHVNDTTDDGPRDWYGQMKVPSTSPGTVQIVPGAHFGRDLHVLANGYGAIVVPQFAASKLIRNYPSIDIVDFDVQGEEFVVVYGAVEALNERAKRLHIGTHGPEIEHNLRELLKRNGWTCIRDYACAQTNKTPVGEFHFVDGIQTWVNTRFA